MAADIQLNLDTTNAITITINSVADGSSATSSAVTLGNPAPHEVGVHVVLDGNSASNVDYVEWYVMWSEDNTAFTDANNAKIVHVTKMNGTTAVDDHFSFPVIHQYWKLYMVNQSGDAMNSTGNSAEYWEIAVDQA